MKIRLYNDEDKNLERLVDGLSIAVANKVEHKFLDDVERSDIEYFGLLVDFVNNSDNATLRSVVNEYMLREIPAKPKKRTLHWNVTFESTDHYTITQVTH